MWRYDNCHPLQNTTIQLNVRFLYKVIEEIKIYFFNVTLKINN